MVVCVVTPVNYAPELPEAYAELTLPSFTRTPVHLSGSDPDPEDQVRFVITSLPTLGTLYTVEGARIAESRYVLPAGVDVVHFEPVMLDALPLLHMGESAFFGYTAMDDMGMLPTKGAAEAIVSVVVAEGASMPLVSGDGCYAPLFDGRSPLS
eukprot:6405223-Pyramimonas_sp.AAC.1